MAIVIGSNFSYNGFLFLDERQGLPKTPSDLKNWNTSVPEGFEVYLPNDGEWYIYKSSNNDPVTGHFIKRNQSNYDEIDKINLEIDKIRDDISEVKETINDNYTSLDDKIDSVNQDLTETKNELSDLINDFDNSNNVIYADTFNDLLKDSNWIINGKNYSKVGIRVSVINDGSNNGVYRLISSDYKVSTNWIKLIDSNDLILSGDNNETISSDKNIYSAKRADEKFTRRDQPETITEDWKFNHISAETSEIKDLADHIFKNVKVGMNNMLRNTSFSGEYDSAEFLPDSALNSNTQLYSQQYEYWGGVGTWTIVVDRESVTGFSVTLTSRSELSQKIEEAMIVGESYVLSFKSKGTVTANVDGQTYSTNSTDYNYHKYKFNYSGTPNCTVIFTGVGSICEPKLERGTVATSWYPSTKDTDPVANLINEYGYLKTAFKFYNGDCASGILIKEVIQAVKYVDGDPVGEAKAGLSGIYNSDGNVFMWAGGDYSSASTLAGKLGENPNYIPTDEELQNLAKLVITFGGEVYLNGRGRFRGYYESKSNGNRVIIDSNDGTIYMYNYRNQQVFKAYWNGSNLIFSSGYWPTNEDLDNLKVGEIYLDKTVQSGVNTNDGFLKVKGSN